MNEKLIIFSAPSGSGKTTIVRHLLNKGYNLEFSVSAFSRSPRAGEVNGKDYYFLTVEDFRQKIDNKEFVEWEEVYDGRFYGTLKSELERIWKKGNTVLFDIDVAGGVNIKKLFGNKALSVFVMPPSVAELEQRLISRGTDSEAEIKRRIAKAEEEISFARHFDCVILNDDLEIAKAEAEEVLQKFLAQN